MTYGDSLCNIVPETQGKVKKCGTIPDIYRAIMLTELDVEAKEVID